MKKTIYKAKLEFKDNTGIISIFDTSINEYITIDISMVYNILKDDDTLIIKIDNDEEVKIEIKH